MRFSLKWMLAAVAFVGFGCTALYNANEVWAGITVGITLVALLVAILGVIYLQPRAFYIGMCIFGWGYLFLNYLPQMKNSGRPSAVMDRPLLAVYPVLDFLHESMRRDVPVDGIDPDGPPAHLIRQGPAGYTYTMPMRNYFTIVGHSLFALVFALIGGTVGQWISRGAKCNST